MSARGWTTSSHAAGLDHNEQDTLPVTAGPGTAAEHAPASLLAHNGLRMPEAVGADVENTGSSAGNARAIRRLPRTYITSRPGAGTGVPDRVAGEL
jgi:hypothetical protein